MDSDEDCIDVDDDDAVYESDVASAQGAWNGLPGGGETTSSFAMPGAGEAAEAVEKFHIDVQEAMTRSRHEADEMHRRPSLLCSSSRKQPVDSSMYNATESSASSSSHAASWDSASLEASDLDM